QGMHFKIRRILGYGNSFQPVVIGDIAPGAFGGSEVRVRMRLQALVIAFMVVWFGFLSIIAVAFVVQSARRRDAHATGDFGFFGGLAMFAGMALFMYGLTSAGFWYEVKKAKSLLL